MDLTKNILVSNDVKRDKRKSVGEDWCGGESTKEPKEHVLTPKF